MWLSRARFRADFTPIPLQIEGQPGTAVPILGVSDNGETDEVQYLLYYMATGVLNTPRTSLFNTIKS